VNKRVLKTVEDLMELCDSNRMKMVEFSKLFEVDSREFRLVVNSSSLRLVDLLIRLRIFASVTYLRKRVSIIRSAQHLREILAASDLHLNTFE
jgi:hypothetical protein